jgi:hypothetical protein
LKKETLDRMLNASYVSEKSVLFNDTDSILESRPNSTNLLCLNEMMDTIPSVSYEKEQVFLQNLSKTLKESDQFASDKEEKENKSASYILDNLFYMWIPNQTEPIIVSYSEMLKTFKGKKFRVITLRDLTADF